MLVVLAVSLNILLTGCTPGSFGEPHKPITGQDPTADIPGRGRILGHVVMETGYGTADFAVPGGPGVITRGTTDPEQSSFISGPEYRDSDILVSFNENTPQGEITELISSYGYHVKRIIERAGIYVIGIPKDTDPRHAAESFLNNPQVKHAQPNLIGRITGSEDGYIQGIPDDLYFPRQWALKAMAVPYAWDKVTGSRSVTIAIIDTGVQANHPDLTGNIGQGYNFYRGDRDVTDYNGHGTHIAGTIGAVTNNGRGISGINWRVNIMPLKVSDDSGGGDLGLSEIIDALYYAADNGADIVNMSFQIGGKNVESDYHFSFMEEAIDYAYSKGLTMIAAAGNNRENWLAYPARNPKVIAAGAIGSDLNRADWSHYGAALDFVAPGVDIISAWNRGNYDYASGTSMATSQITGVVGLLIASGIRGPERIRGILRETAMDLGAPGRDDYYGWGLVNAHAAVNGALITKMKVFVGEDDRVSVTPRSDMANPVLGGAFKIGNVEKGSWYVYGWIDTNNNGIIDEGDYYGRTSTKITYDTRDLTGIKLRVKPNIGVETAETLKLAAGN